MTSIASAAAGYASAAHAPATRVPRKVIAAAIAGNALEFYEFTVYTFFAVYAAATFFPSDDPLASLLAAVAVFGVGFFTRPVGAIVIGRLGDRIGRKPALLLTIVLLIVGTAAIALTPGYASIGVAAPVIVVLGRLVQGFGLGGEVGSASAFLVEIAPPGKRGLFMGWQGASQGISSLCAGIVGLTLTSVLPAQAMQSWGWRSAFLVGLLLIPISLYLRKHMPETLESSPGQEAVKTPPVSELLNHGRAMLFGMLMMAAGTTALYVALYMTTYSIVVLKMPPSTGMVSAIVTGSSLLVFSLLGGWLSDRFGRKSIMTIAWVILLVLIYPAYRFLIASPSVFNLAAVTLLLTAIPGLASTAMLTLIAESYPQRLRALGLGLTYALPVTLFGGTAQFVVTWLLKTTGDAASPAYYAVAACLVMLAAVAGFPSLKPDPARG